MSRVKHAIILIILLSGCLMANISIDIGKIMNEGYYKSFHHKGRYLVEHGGAGSGKSVFVAQKILWRTITESDNRFMIMRKVAKANRLSTFLLFKDLISEWGIRSEFKILENDMSIKFLPNGNMLYFLGMDDPEKIKSITKPTGVWMEEASEFTSTDFEQLDLRLRGSFIKTYFQIIVSYNPISEKLWIKPAFFDTNQYGETYIHLSTYKDNRFLDDGYKLKLERYIDRDEQLYRIYCLGEWGVLTGLIYTMPEIISWDKYPEIFDVELIGVDWGYNNPMSLTHIGIKDRDVYLTELFYETEFTTDQLILNLPTLGIGHRMATKDIKMVCDSAEPDRIEMFRRAGYNVIGAYKGKGSVQTGIDVVKMCKIYSCDANVNINSEFGLYRWKLDKEGNAMDEPLKEHDHSMDGIRYAIFDVFGQPVPEAKVW